MRQRAAGLVFHLENINTDRPCRFHVSPELHHFLFTPVPQLRRKDFVQTAVPGRISQRRIHAPLTFQKILFCNHVTAAGQQLQNQIEIIPCSLLAHGVFAVSVQQEQIRFFQTVTIHLQFRENRHKFVRIREHMRNIIVINPVFFQAVFAQFLPHIIGNAAFCTDKIKSIPCHFRHRDAVP